MDFDGDFFEEIKWAIIEALQEHHGPQRVEIKSIICTNNVDRVNEWLRLGMIFLNTYLDDDGRLMYCIGDTKNHAEPKKE